MMYTLEDDRETSESLRKQQLLAQAQAQNRPPTSQAVPGKPTVLLPGEQADASLTATQPAGVEAQSTVIETQATTIENQPTAPIARLRPPGRGIGLAALTIACIGVFFTALDQTVVVTALPAIINNLNVPLTQLDHAAWIVSAYLLGFIIAMPLMGRVSDIYGRRLILLLCLLIFGVGSILCALAPELGQTWNLSFLTAFHIDVSSPGLVWLITARFFQAIGGGAIVPIAMAIASDFYGKKHRGLALGVIGGVTEAGGALGPLYGALIVQHSGWQTIFYLNVPIVVLIGFAAWFFVPKGVKVREGIDWLGALLLGIALTCLSLGLSQQGASLSAATAGGQGPQNNPVALILSLIIFAAFVLVERKVRWPVVDLKLFKRLPFSAASLVSLFVGAALIIALANIPIYVDTVLQLSVLDSGLALLRLTMMIPVGALIGGWLCGKLTCRFTGLLGLLFTAGGFYLMSLWPATADWNLMTASTLTAGLGFGLVIAPISTTATNAVRANQVGMSSAIVTALRMGGMMLGLAALTSWALTYFKQLAGTYTPLNSAMTADQFARLAQNYTHFLIMAAHTVYSSVFFFSMVLCLVALVPAWGLWGRQHPEAEPRTTIALAPEGAQSLHSLQPYFTRQKAGLLGGGLALLLIFSGIFVGLIWGHGESLSKFDVQSGAAPAGTRLVQLALDDTSLTSLFVSQLHLQKGALSDLKVSSVPNNGLVLKLNLNINAAGIHRVLPVEIDGTLSLDQQKSIRLHVTHLRRDGIDAGPAAAATMGLAMDKLLQTELMPSLRSQLKDAQLVSIKSGTAFPCSKGVEMLALEIRTSAAQGLPSQSDPLTFCLKGPLDLNKLLPH